MRIFKKINKSNIKNKLKTNDKNIKIIKFLLLIGKIHCLSIFATCNISYIL